MTETRVRDLFDVPERVGKQDFVLSLTAGIASPAATVDSYVPTPALVDSLDRALALVGSSLNTGRSQASYLHGSFGSGKSHFMAVLSLLLNGSEIAWRVPELHALRAKHAFVGQKKLLELHFHMIGKDSIESAIFSEYVRQIRELHPKATIPGVYADEELFANAEKLLNELGDEKFFAPMNPEGEDEWGEFGSVWDRARFEACAASAKLKEREQLFTALIDTRFSAYAGNQRAFVDIDSGLSTLARHAQDLGYDGVVLFLDELILWLSHKASDSAWLHNEVQKMVKLVEAQDTSRPIPIISFIARQRNLAEMVGDQYAGNETANLNGSLKHWEGRYDTIPLEDRNLPAIIERRVLKPKGDDARRTLADTFASFRRDAGKSWDTLVGNQDAAAFEQTYPFSPALVEALVALSAFLQRDRTAIRVLMEILVEHIDDLKLGQVVCVGDLFDLLAGGEEATDGAMRQRFKVAKDLYRQVLPLIQEQNGTTTAEKCQRLRDSHALRLGCSNCPQAACRADNRLVKTLLLAALVPEVKALKDLTASRLQALNHGSIKTRIAGQEANMVGQKLRKWVAANVSQLRVGDQEDPSVSIQLEGVDVKPIMDAASTADTDGARQRVLRELLFSAMGIDPGADAGQNTEVEWKEHRWPGHLRFGNVRLMNNDQLRCPAEHEWRLIIDFPFDSGQHGPGDDQARLDGFIEETDGSWTLVWLPHFFSQSANQQLGELVILEHILASKDSERKYLQHLSLEHQTRASLDLGNLREVKRVRLRQFLEQAYGLASPEDENLDPGARVERQLQLLKPGAQLQQQLAANLADVRENYVQAILGARYPRHPNLHKKITPRRVEELVELFGDLIDSDNGRIPADKAKVDEAKVLGELGLVRVTENAVHLLENQTLQRLESRRSQQAIEVPTAGQIRGYIDPDQRMGLYWQLEDLILRCYTRWSKRTLVRGDRPFQASAKQQIDSEVLLEKPDLPAQTAWEKAYDVASHTLGLSLAGRALHADNLKRFQTQLNTKLDEYASAVSALPAALSGYSHDLGLPSETDRWQTARSTDELIASLKDQPAVAQINTLAGTKVAPSFNAASRSIGSARANVELLRNRLVLGVFTQLQGRAADLPGAAELLEEVASALRQDELQVALAERLRALAEQGQRLLAPAPGKAAPPVVAGTAVVAAAPAKPAGMRSLQRVELGGDVAAAKQRLSAFLEALDAARAEHGEALQVIGALELLVPSQDPKP